MSQGGLVRGTNIYYDLTKYYLLYYFNSVNTTETGAAVKSMVWGRLIFMKSVNCSSVLLLMIRKGWNVKCQDHIQALFWRVWYQLHARRDFIVHYLCVCVCVWIWVNVTMTASCGFRPPARTTGAAAEHDCFKVSSQRTKESCSPLGHC